MGPLLAQPHNRLAGEILARLQILEYWAGTQIWASIKLMDLVQSVAHGPTNHLDIIDEI